MSAESVKSTARPDPNTTEHELPAVLVDGESVPVRVIVHRLNDGGWRGRILFGRGDLDETVSTAEILYGNNESEFWRCVRDLREHHLRDLYRSVSQ